MLSFNCKEVLKFFKTYWVNILTIFLIFMFYMFVLACWFILKEGDEVQLFIVEVIKSPHLLDKTLLLTPDELWYCGWGELCSHNLELYYQSNIRHPWEPVPSRNLDINPVLSCAVIIFICFFNSLIIEELISDLL